MCTPCAHPADTHGFAAVCAQAAQPSRALLHAKNAYGHKHYGPAKHGHGYGHKHHGPAKHGHGAYGVNITHYPPALNEAGIDTCRRRSRFKTLRRSTQASTTARQSMATATATITMAQQSTATALTVCTYL